MNQRCSLLGILSAFMLLAGCTPERMQGVNLLQSRQVSFEQAPTKASFERLSQLGANTVAVVVFLEQEAPGSTSVRKANAVTEAQFRAALRSARQQGLQVLAKPQFLVPESWAGEIEFTRDEDWQDWFDAYQSHLLDYARIAREEGASGLVVGTELRRSEQRPEWRSLITTVRNVFPGTLTYAAHELEGLKGFQHWDLLDLAGVTLYPALGAEPNRASMQSHIERTTSALRAITANMDKPVWIAEIGIQSRAGAQLEPWQWRHTPADAEPAPDLQADVIDLWLKALDGDWNRGALLWAWSNDPHAGGLKDLDYLLQNKPAENILQCHWLSQC